VRSGSIAVGFLSLALASCATIPTPQEANDAVLMLRKYGSWAWALGIALIWADLVLPVPQTAVIAALGIIDGTLLGGLLGGLGLTSVADRLRKILGAADGMNLRWQRHDRRSRTATRKAGGVPRVVCSGASRRGRGEKPAALRGASHPGFRTADPG
jgi:hypothetical protein